MKSHRAAQIVELALIVVTLGGILVLIVIWMQLGSILAHDESPVLVGARILRGLVSLAVPLAILIFLFRMRPKIDELLSRQKADQTTADSAKRMWFIVIGMIVILLLVDANVIHGSFQDIRFK